MKQNIILKVYILFSLIFITFISGCTKNIEIQPDSNSQFDIYYSFGVEEKHILDTKNKIYIKDMVCNPSKEYNFELTESEKEKIYNSILENNLLNIKDEFTKNCNSSGCQQISPLSTATLNIALNGKTKTIKWSANYIDTNDPELKNLQNVRNIIDEIIIQKEKEMNIEQPKCGYL